MKLQEKRYIKLQHMKVHIVDTNFKRSFSFVSKIKNKMTQECDYIIGWLMVVRHRTPV